MLGSLLTGCFRLLLIFFVLEERKAAVLSGIFSNLFIESLTVVPLSSIISLTPVVDGEVASGRAIKWSDTHYDHPVCALF